jgi:choline dehydrogenase-like flavoprotein
MGLHGYIPFWQYKEIAEGKFDTPRGYHVEIGGGFGEPGVGSFGGYDGYGPELRARVKQRYGARLGFTQRGEMIPNKDCYAELDPEKKDRFGIPVMRFHWKWSQHEINQVKHFQNAMRELIDKLGGEINEPAPPERAISTGGEIIHEVGTARMGSNARDSVTDQFGKTWDVDNLYLCDGSIFVSKAHKNPTITIMALAMRNAESIAGRLRSGEL